MVIVVVFFWSAVFILLYTLVGYPLIIAVLAKKHTRQEYSGKDLPNVTLIIPAYNEENIIGRKIENSLKLKYPRNQLQILIAADGSDDKTPDVVREFEAEGIELSYTSERGGKMAAINRAISKVRGEIIVFSDANNFYNEDAIVRLVAPFEDKRVGGTTGAKLIIEDERDLSSAESTYWKYESAIKLNESIVSSCTSAVGEMLAIRKELFVFPPSNVINDDRYLVLDLIRRGHRVEYVPEARSYEYVSASAKDEIIRRRRMNAGGFQIISMSGKLLPKGNWLEIWKIISHKYLRTILPFALLIILGTNIIAVMNQGENVSRSFLMLGFPYGWIFLILQLIFYLLSLVGNLFPERGQGKLKKLLYLPTYFVNSNIAILSGLLLFFIDENSHIWERVERFDG
jgi:cellulose synthase/poly-beta-1,6-N-acetylglucosamine synthase-like glycosyltransferase